MVAGTIKSNGFSKFSERVAPPNMGSSTLAVLLVL
jgi:hypothetical protein